jgi:hypothetical protein
MPNEQFFSYIMTKKQAKFNEMNDDDVLFVLDQHA